MIEPLDEKLERIARDGLHYTKQVKAILIGADRDTSAFVIADLLGMFLACHPPKIRAREAARLLRLARNICSHYESELAKIPQLSRENH